jgi:hypothetical protein
MANWIGVVIGILGLLFAVYERLQRVKVETIIRDTLRRLAGEVKVVFSNANWADTHLRNIGYLFAEASPDLGRIRTEAFDGARDAAACARQLGLAHSQIRGIQRTLFNDSEETLPEIQADDVRAAQSHNAPRPTGPSQARVSDS